jgi:hypothetical protein
MAEGVVRKSLQNVSKLNSTASVSLGKEKQQ